MTVVVAGSARGIGLELVRRLSADWDVLAIDTYCSPELQVLCDAPRSGRMAVSFAKADVADLQSLQAAAARASTVSALFVVAGVLGCPQPLLAANRDVDPSEDLLRTIRVNTVGPLNVVRAFLDVLEDKATILLMSSTMASLTSAVHDLNPTYSMSKAALNMLGRKLAVELAPRGIDVVMMSPGVVITEMNGYKGDITPQQSVEGMLRALARPGESGRFIRYDGQTWPW